MSPAFATGLGVGFATFLGPLLFQWLHENGWLSFGPLVLDWIFG